jgi:alpha-galactosidase
VRLHARFKLFDQLNLYRFTRTVNAHGSIVLKLSGTTAAAPVSFTYYNAAATGNVLSNGAATRAVNSTATVVGFIGGSTDGTLVIKGVDGGTNGGSKLTSIDFINGDYTQSDSTACPNCRVAFFSVNGGPSVGAQMPISGMVCDSHSRLGR